MNNKEGLRNYGLLAAWFISLAGTAASLFFSEVLHYIPCNLCWYQRICLYPLVIVLGIATFKDERGIVPYTLPLSIAGMLISLYQNLEQRIPAIANAIPCKVGVPCSHIYIQLFGFVTIPLLSFLAFLLISFLLWKSREN